MVLFGEAPVFNCSLSSLRGGDGDRWVEEKEDAFVLASK